MATFYGIKRKGGRITPPHQLPPTRDAAVMDVAQVDEQPPADELPAPEPSPAAPVPAPDTEETPRALTIPHPDWSPPPLPE